MAKKIYDKYEYPESSLDIVTIEDILTLLSTVDVAPDEIQRNEVASDYWKSKLITDIYRGRHLGIFTYTKQKDSYKVEWKGNTKTVDKKNMNSLQRTTGVLEHIEGTVKILSKTHIKCPTTNKSIDIGGMSGPEIKKQYPDIYNEKFLKRKVILDKVGEDNDYCTPKQETEIFRNLNDNHNTNAQEERNCTVAEIAKDVRNKSRLTPNLLYKLLGYKNDRMQYDKNRLHQMHFLQWGLTKAPSRNSLDAMYENEKFEKKEDELEVWSIAMNKDIKLGKTQDNIEKFMTEFLKDEKYKEGINESWHNSLFFYSFLILDQGKQNKYNYDILKDSFFRTHVKLITPTEETEHEDTVFRRALSEMGQVKSIRIVINSWRKELGFDKQDRRFD